MRKKKSKPNQKPKEREDMERKVKDFINEKSNEHYWSGSNSKLVKLMADFAETL